MDDKLEKKLDAETVRLYRLAWQRHEAATVLWARLGYGGTCVTILRVVATLACDVMHRLIRFREGYEDLKRMEAYLRTLSALKPWQDQPGQANRLRVESYFSVVWNILKEMESRLQALQDRGWIDEPTGWELVLRAFLADYPDCWMELYPPHDTMLGFHIRIASREALNKSGLKARSRDFEKLQSKLDGCVGWDMDEFAVTTADDKFVVSSHESYYVGSSGAIPPVYLFQTERLFHDFWVKEAVQGFASQQMDCEVEVRRRRNGYCVKIWKPIDSSNVYVTTRPSVESTCKELHMELERRLGGLPRELISRVNITVHDWPVNAAGDSTLKKQQGKRPLLLIEGDGP